MTWTAITADQTLAVANGYISNKGTLNTLTLPTSAAVGDIIEVVGMGAGGWQIAQNASQIIHFGNIDSTTGTGGHIDSINRRDRVYLICVVANLEFNAYTNNNLTYV